MKDRFIVTKVSLKYGLGSVNIYDIKLEMFANDCNVAWIKGNYHKVGYLNYLYWEALEKPFKDKFKEVNLPLEAYLLLN